MKLFVSALVALATAGAAITATGQNQPSTGTARIEGTQPAPVPSPQQMEKLWMQSQTEAAPDLLNLGLGTQTGCPVVLTSASVTPRGRMMPVAQWTQDDGSLWLQFQYQSRLPIQSVSATAHLKVKTDEYALNARDLEIPLTFSSTVEMDRPGQHSLKFALPQNLYLYGVVRVSLESVTFTTGQVWRPAPADRCGVNGNGLDRVEAK